MKTKGGPNVATKRKGRIPWLLLTTGVALVALVGMVTWPGAGAGAPTAIAEDADIVVYKTAACSCCGRWVAHLRDAGFKVDPINVSNMQAIHSRIGVPGKLSSCHTAVAGDYWIEGHVPADLIQQLVADSPANIRGIAVPGMPIGSPGMEGPNPAEYDIVAYDSTGGTSVYATREGQSEN